MDCCITQAIRGMWTDIKITRTPPGAYDSHGRWEDPSPIEMTIKAVVQPAQAHELVKLPEGRRTKGTVVIYTQTKLQTADVKSKLQPDVVFWHGDQYQVESLEDWTDDGGFYKVLALEIGQ